MPAINFYLLLSIAMSIAIGFWGTKKRIGFWYAFIISVTLSPILGFILTIVSPSLNSKSAYKDIKGKYIVLAIACWIAGASLALFSMKFILTYITAPSGELNHPDADYYYLPMLYQGIFYLFIASGFFVLGFYLKNPPNKNMPVEVEYQ